MNNFKIQIDSGDAAVASIRIYDVIGSWGEEWGQLSAKDFIEEMDEKCGEGVKQLNIYINSPGGDVFESMTIFNALKRHPAKKCMIIDGMCASGASVIAMAGDEISMGPGSQIMIHEAWTCQCGGVEDFKKCAEDLTKTNSQMAEIYAKRCGQSVEDIKKMMAYETYFTPEEAKEKGLCDKIVGESTSKDEQKSWNPSNAKIMASFKGRRSAPSMALEMETKPVELTKEDEKMTVELKARAEKAEGELAQLFASTGKGSISEISAMVASLKEQAVASEQLREQLASLQSTEKARQISSLLDEAVKEGKLTPAKRIDAEKSPFVSDVKTLQAFLEFQPKAVIVTESVKPVIEKASALTEDEKYCCKAMGIDEKSYLETKKGKE